MSDSYRYEIDHGSSPEDRITLPCGECGRPVLTRDMVLTGEGVHCQECLAKMDQNYREYKAGLSRAAVQSGNSSQRPPSQESPVIEVKVDTTRCKRHPEIETGLRCSRCGTPICPRCMVYSPVGLRCPDCARNLENALKAEQQVFSPPKKKVIGSSYPLVARDYLLAALVALATAIVGALAWGILLNANLLRPSTVVPGQEWFRASGQDNLNVLATLAARSFQGSIHLFPEIILGLVIGTVMMRVTGERRSRPLQFIAVGATLLGIFLSFVVLTVRIYLTYSAGSLPVGDLLGTAFSAFFYMFQGSTIAIPIFWAAGLALAWVRLNR